MLVLAGALCLALCGCGSAASPRWAGGREEVIPPPDTTHHEAKPPKHAPESTPEVQPEPGPAPQTALGPDEAEVQVPALAYSARPGYRLGPGDELSFEFPFDRDLTSDAIVRPDGKTTAPGLGEIPAAGYTVAELDSLLHIAYLKVLRHPMLSVNVKKLGANSVYIFGEVGTPGAVEIIGNMSVVQLVARAGGIKASGTLKSVLLLRRMPGGAVHARRINVARVLEGHADAPDQLLAPNDIVYVPRSFIGKLNLFVDQYLTNLIVPTLATYLRGWEIADPNRFFYNPNTSQNSTTGGATAN